MNISVLHPTVRPAEALANLKRWKERASDWSRVEYLLCGDVLSMDPELIPVIAEELGEQGNLILMPPKPGYAYKLNEAGRQATGEVLVESHDDLLPPLHWDDLIEKAILDAERGRLPDTETRRVGEGETNTEASPCLRVSPSPCLGEVVLRVKHGGDRQASLCVPMILTRERWARYGFVTHPELVHLFSDDYFTWLADRDGVIVEAPHIEFVHDHPYLTKTRKWDAVYENNYNSSAWSIGQRIYGRLKVAVEPIQWRDPSTGSGPTSGGESLEIHVAIGNRKILAGQCLRNLRERTPKEAQIHVWLDDKGPDTPVQVFNGPEGENMIFHSGPGVGIEAQRVQHLRWFMDHGADWCYFTDADVVHAPGWFEALRRLHLETGCLTGGYRTGAHAHNVTEDLGAYLRQKYLPGVSMLMNRAQVEIITRRCNPESGKDVLEHPEGLGGFDWEIPRLLGNQCVCTGKSWLDHVGYGGLHHPKDNEEAAGDRAMFPVGDVAALVKELWPLAREK